MQTEPRAPDSYEILRLEHSLDFSDRLQGGIMAHHGGIRMLIPDIRSEDEDPHSLVEMAYPIPTLII